MKKVLVIDDDPLIGSVYVYLLTSAGFKVQFVRDATDALVALKTFQPDVALLDLDLPDINGIEWLREIRTYPTLGKLPVIVFTAGTKPELIKAAYASDALFVLSKQDTPPEEVVKAVVKAAGGAGKMGLAA